MRSQSRRNVDDGEGRWWRLTRIQEGPNRPVPLVSMLFPFVAGGGVKGKIGLRLTLFDRHHQFSNIMKNAPHGQIEHVTGLAAVETGGACSIR